MTDYEKACTLSELTKATKQCARGVRYKDSVANYLLDSLSRNHKLREDLISDSYKISPYLHFEITEPKHRNITATRFRDRVWQKSMCNNGLREALLKPLIYDNGACQKNKGVDFAIDRAICFCQRYYRKHHTNEGWYAHLDVKSYFPSTPHSVAKRIVSEKVADDNIKQHVFNIIDSFSDSRSKAEIEQDSFGERGIALGSEISQLLQLNVLNRVDHAVKEKLKMKYYIRFNDDMVLISEDKDKLKECIDFISAECAKLGLAMTVKTMNGRLSQGINFLKRRIVLTHTGKVIVKAKSKKFVKERRILRKLKRLLAHGKTTMDRIIRHYQSVRGILARCDNPRKIKALDRFYYCLFGEKPPIIKKKEGIKNAYSKTKCECRRRRKKTYGSQSGKCETPLTA